MSSETVRIPACSGAAFEVPQGGFLRVIDPEGGQVADVVAFAREDPFEVISNGHSIDYEGTLGFTCGKRLFSNRSRVLLTIVADDVGRHDFLHAACSPEMFRLQGEPAAGRRSCRVNLGRALAKYGFDERTVPTPFNVFMDVVRHADGRLEVRPAASRAGDAIFFRAELDVVVAIAACSASICNGGECTPIDVVLERPSDGRARMEP